MKSEKNKTIDFSAEEGKEYLSRCIKVEQKIGVAEITNKTIFGNTNEVLPLLPNSFVDLLIADPPYNLEKNFHGNTFHTLKEQDYEEYTEKWISLIEPILKPNASIYVCCDWKCSSAIHRVLERHFTVMNRITWQREKGRGAMQNWKNGMEDIWFAVKSDNYTFNIDDVKTRRKVIAPYKDDGKPKDWEETSDGKFRNTYPSNFWDDISIPYWSMPENTAHPTQKPEKLLAKLILASSNKGDFVFDPFLGSGSTSVTAKKLGRNFCALPPVRVMVPSSTRTLPVCTVPPDMARSPSTKIL
ncbi:MAG: site-specific DNA-methyltransferase [Treponema sp.]|nr:site-specific DNA-methyltransferase [Treponema sp.]